ncbi:hypothetical protein Tco_0883037 [Tanacetum coccineum]
MRSLFKNVFIRNSLNEHSSLVLKPKCNVMWRHTLKGWKGSRKSSISKERRLTKKMMEMFILLKEFTKGKSLEKVLVREEVSKPVTKYVNAISLVRMEDDKGKEDKSVNEGSTRWGKYVDRLMEMSRNSRRRVGGRHWLCVPRIFVILDIKEDEHMPLILGTPFLTTTRAEIKFDKGSMTLKAGRYKIIFVRTLEFPKWEERIKISKRTKWDAENFILRDVGVGP